MSPTTGRKIRNAVVDPETGCWNWTAYVDGKGYAYTAKGPAHREVWKERVGPIPDGLHLHHECENTVCVNPDHMQLVTQLEHAALHWGVTFPQLRAAYEAGRDPAARAEDVAKRFGISRRNVQALWAGENWHAVTGGEPITPDRRICAWEGCENVVVAKNRMKRYCSRTCCARASRARIRDREALAA